MLIRRVQGKGYTVRYDQSICFLIEGRELSWWRGHFFFTREFEEYKFTYIFQVVTSMYLITMHCEAYLKKLAPCLQ